MTLLHRTLSLGLLACALAACNRQGPDVPTAISKTPQNAEDPNGVNTVVLVPNTAFVGSEIDDRGDLVKPQHVFAPGSTVYVSVPSKGRKLGARMEAFWFHEDGKSRKEDTKQIAGPFTAFEFQPTDTGKYNVEIDVNNRPISLVEFEVK